MAEGRLVSIWFFIGMSLLVNGVIILGAGLYECRIRRQSMLRWCCFNSTRAFGGAAC